MFFPPKTPRCKPRPNKRLKEQEQMARLKEQEQMSELLHNMTASSPNFPYVSLAIASSPLAIPLPRSPVPALKLLLREPPNQVKPAREESSSCDTSETIPAPSQALPAAASGSDSPKVARHKRRERIENGCEDTEVLQDETIGLCTWRDVTDSLPDNNPPPDVSSSTKSSRSTKLPDTQHFYL